MSFSIKKFLLYFNLLLFCAIIILFVISLNSDRNTYDTKDDEVGLSELKKYISYHSLNIDDFEQPTIWVQKSKEARKDPRGRCITVCYQTKENVSPRHIILLYLTYEDGIIDYERLIE